MESQPSNDLEHWFYKNKGDIVKFHFDLSNCMHLIMEDYQQGSFYCFCNKIKMKCSLCKMQSAFEEKKKKGLERLVVFQYDMEMLTKIANEIFRFLKECFELDSWSLDFFNREYLWTCCSYDGTYSYLSLQEIIDYDEYLDKTRKLLSFKFLKKKNVSKKSLSWSLFDDICH